MPSLAGVDSSVRSILSAGLGKVEDDLAVRGKMAFVGEMLKCTLEANPGDVLVGQPLVPLDDVFAGCRKHFRASH